MSPSISSAKKNSTSSLFVGVYTDKSLEADGVSPPLLIWQLMKSSRNMGLSKEVTSQGMTGTLGCQACKTGRDQDTPVSILISSGVVSNSGAGDATSSSVGSNSGTGVGSDSGSINGQGSVIVCISSPDTGCNSGSGYGDVFFIHG